MNAGGKSQGIMQFTQGPPKPRLIYIIQNNLYAYQIMTWEDYSIMYTSNEID